jgi:hypothetical protein
VENVGRGIGEAEPEPSRDADSSTLLMGNSLATTRRGLNPLGPRAMSPRVGQFTGVKSVPAHALRNFDCEIPCE